MIGVEKEEISPLSNRGAIRQGAEMDLTFVQDERCVPLLTLQAKTTSTNRAYRLLRSRNGTRHASQDTRFAQKEQYSCKRFAEWKCDCYHELRYLPQLMMTTSDRRHNVRECA